MSDAIEEAGRKRGAILAETAWKWFTEKIIPIIILLLITWLIWATTQIFGIQQSLAIKT